MKQFAMMCAGLVALASLVSGCSSLRIIDGSTMPPQWIADPTVLNRGSAQPVLDTDRYIYAAGVATYAVVLEDGIHSARHDAIRKIAERVGIAADDIYRSDRVENYKIEQSGMPNTPQFFPNSRKAVDASDSLNSAEKTNPIALHVSKNRIHNIEECHMEYTVWRYKPSFMAKLLRGDSALRFYDVYVLMRVPRDEFNSAISKDKESLLNEVLPTPGAPEETN